MISFFALSALAFLLCARMYLRKGVSAIEVYIILYAYFFFGPYIASQSGYEVYSGIDFRFIGSSILVFYISVFAILIGLLLPGFGFKGRDFSLAFQPSERSKALVYIPVLASSALMVLYSYYVGSLFSYENKVIQISRVGVSHYAFITLAPCLLICYMALFDREKGRHRGFYLSVFMYGLYSLLMGERDFLLFSLPVYFWHIRRTRSGYLYPAIMSAVLALSFVLMSASRSDVMSQGMVGSFLNQGSNLMVMTTLMTYLDSGGDHIYGLSYLSAIVNASTLGLVRLWGPCSVWLSNYFSGGAGAYGFSLEAEAFFNFGYLGVFGFFFLFARYYRHVEKLADRGGRFGMLLYFHFLFFFIYSMRGEFLTILKSFMYCVIFYFIIISVIGRGRFLTDFLGDRRRG